MPWQSPTITVKWGNYFAPDPAEQKQIVELVKAALDAKAITTRMAVEKLAPIFGIENVEAALEAIEKEREQAAERDVQRFAAEQGAIHKAAADLEIQHAQSGGDRAGRGEKPPSPAGRGSGGPPAANPKA